ncbi:MAG: type I 3-dehydroquinate dehydratase [Candidatus Bathyarchaeum sp.]|nr:MAG: type I 3-dehydroquinate dehydratase [Candidatus Bathyarchaeum sp.]
MGERRSRDRTLTIRVCVAVPPKTVDEAFSLIEQAEAQHADLIEIRLDSLTNYNRIADIPECSKTPLIATNKSLDNHGSFSGSETERQKILLDAANNGFTYVDVDLGTPNQAELISNLHEAGAKVIVSFHDFEQTPSISTLEKIVGKEVALGADICKIITTANTVEDNSNVINFVSKASKKAKIVCFAMGDLGVPSRFLSPVFGAFFTFASIDEKRKTAKGQLTIQEMRKAYQLLGLK